MKQPLLQPAIVHIERRLSGITEGLIQAVERGQTSAVVAQAVRASPEWCAYQSDMAQMDITPTSGLQAPVPEMPAHIRDLIRRRVATLPLAEQPKPQSGQIVRVEKIVLPHKETWDDAVLQAPLHVLLDTPAETPDIWYGWLATGEVEYACWWDFVLQEEDAPFDPEAGMVQLWNPVHIYLPMAGPVVARLAPARMQALRSLAADFVTGYTNGAAKSWPGRVAQRLTTAGLPVVTGSPEGGAQDPRHRYQEIYFEAADAIRHPARHAAQALAGLPQNYAGDWLRSLIEAAARLGQSLLPEPHVAVAMGADDQANLPDDLLWPDLARLHLVQLDAMSGLIDITNIGHTDISAKVMRGDKVEEFFSIKPGTSAGLSWDSLSTAILVEAGTNRHLMLPLGKK